MEAKVIEFSEVVQEKKSGSKTNTLKLSLYQLQSLLISGGLNKSSYILLALRLIYGCNQDIEISLEQLAEDLTCVGVTPLGKDKEINFTADDIQIELSKMAKKGLLTTYETPIQLKLSDVQ